MQRDYAAMTDAELQTELEASYEADRLVEYCDCPQTYERQKAQAKTLIDQARAEIKRRARGPITV